MINKETLLMFQELTDAPGAVGFESKPREIMEKWIKPYADSIQTDNLGSIVALKKGTYNGPKIMIASHLDEVGYMISQITEDGFLRFIPLGGWWEQVMLAQRVTVVTRTGTIEGVVGSKPPHLITAEDRKKPVEIKDMFIDIGASSKEEAIEFGVRPGDFVVPACPFTVMKNPKLLMAKAWDNRIGCAIVIEVLKRLQSETHPNDVYGVGTVQEEVGLRGAQTSAQMIHPDLAIAIDVGVAGDTPGISPNEATSKIGKGPQLFLMDKTMIAHEGLRNFVIDIAEEKNIPFQLEAAPYGGTDAGSIHTILNGVPSLALTIPTRYIHSNASIIHYDDFEATVSLFVEVIKKLDRDLVDKIRSFSY